MLEQLQLTEDLVTICGSVYTRAGARLVAEQLYACGVRSRLAFAGVCGRCTAEGQGERPAVGESPRGWPRCASCLYNDGHDDAMAGWHGEVGGQPKPEQMSEVPGHVQSLARTRMREFVGAEILVREDPDWGRASEIAKIRWDGIAAYVVLRPEVSLVPPQAKCRRCTAAGGACRYHAVREPAAAPGVPNPVPDRPLPEGVQRVMQFVHQLQVSGWKPADRVFIFAGVPGRASNVKLIDLQAILAEIPDAAPRYPTIWAYEQACRTIRERDARIEKALELADRVEEQLGDEVPGSLDELRMALRLRMPRTVPATDEEKSDVARAFEACDTDDDAEIGGSWSTVARTLRDEALRLAGEVEHLRTLGDAVAAEVPEPEPRCPSCEHRTSSHHEDGCWFTVRNGTEGEILNCPCTFNARAGQQEANSE
jgi:hypothetical protein